MGNPSPATSKLKRESPTSSIKVGPHRRTSSVASSCISLESGDQDVLSSPARGNGLGKSPVASTSSPRTPAGINPGEKSASPAMKKRRSSIGGPDDLARGLDFGTSSPPVEEKKHPFLTRGGGHKKVASPASVTAQTNSPGKKITSTTTPPGKEKLVAGRAISTSVLFPRKLGEAKKDIISPRRPVLASEGSSTVNGSPNEGSGLVAEQFTPKKPSPRASLEGKIMMAGKSSSPRPTMKPKSDIASTKGRTNSNGESAANDSALEAETKAEKSFTPGKSLDGKIRKSSPLPYLKSKPALTSPKSQKSAKRRQDTPSPPQPGRVRTRIEKAARNEELSRPEMESVTMPVYSENENGMETKSEDVVKMETEEDGSTLLPSLMVDGNVGDEDMSSLDQAGGEPDFDQETELPSTSWLSEDLPCMFSSLSHLPEPDDHSSSSLLGDPPEVLDEPFLMEADDLQGYSDESFLANPSDSIAAEEPRSPVVTMDDKFVAAEYPTEISKEMYQLSAVEEPEWNSFNLVEDSVDKFEAEVLRAHEDELESQQILTVPAVVVEEDVVLVAVSQSLLTHDKGETMPDKFTEDISSSIDDNESSVTESGAYEASLQVTENIPTGSEERNLLLASGEGRSEPISSQIKAEPTEITQVVPRSIEADGEICHADSTYSMNAPDAMSVLQEEERRPVADEDEISATHSSLDQLVVASSDDESSEEFLGGSCSAQVNLKQSFDDAAEPALEQITLSSQELALSTDEEILPEVTKLTELEFADESQDGQECETFTATHLDKDMMIFDFEEYWTQNVGDESSQSDAGQNDAEDDLQPNSTMREAQFLNSVEDEAEIFLPQIELPVSNQPVEESIDLEPPGQSSPQLDSEGWPCPNSIPASENCQMDTESANQEEVEEFDEVFHLFEGSDKLSTTAVLFDNLSSPSEPTAIPEELNQEPLHPEVLSQSFDEKIAGESDSSVSPRYTTSTLETEHSNGVDIGQVGQNLQTLNMPEDVEEVAEHQNFSVNTFSLQDSSVAHLSSNTKALECPVDQEDLDTTPMLSVISNGLLGEDIQRLDGHDASDERVDSEDPDLPREDPEFFPSTMQGANSQMSSLETPALSDAYMAVQSDDALDQGPTTQEGCANVVQTAETNGRLDAAKIDDVRELLSDECPLEIEYSQNYPDRDFASPISEVAAGTDVSHDLSSEISSKLLMVEGDENIVISGQSGASAAGAVAKEVIDPLESNAPAISLPPVYGISEEEQTEANFLASLDSKEESPDRAIHNEDSITDHELHINLGQEEPVQGLRETLERDEVTKGYSGCLVGGDLMSISNEPKENFRDMSSESREDKNEVPEHDDFQMLSGAVLPVEERPQSQDDESITTPTLQTVESHGDVDMSEVDQQPQMTLIFAPLPETLQDRSADDETLDYVPTAAADKSLPIGVQYESSDTCGPVFDQEDEIFNDKFDSKSEAKSTASLDEVDVGTNTVTAPPEATINCDNYTDKTSSAEILGKDEAIYSTAAAPVILSAGELPNLTHNEIGEFNKLGSECTVDEEKRGIVDFGEQSRAEQSWEEPLPAPDSSGSKSSSEDVKRDLLSQESMVTHPASSDEIRDTTEDLEIDMDESEEASCTISTAASTPQEILEYHDQESHLLFGASVSTDDQVSRTEAALETQKGLLASSDATFDDDMSEVAFDDHAIKDVEIIPGSAEHFSSQDQPLELLVASNQDTSNAAISDVDEMKEDSDLTQKTDKEGEKLNGDLEPNPSLKDEDTVVDSPKKSFILSSLDTANADEREENSAISWEANEERGSFNGSLKEETVLEVEETVVYSPKNSFVVASGQADTPDANDIQNHSNSSWTTGKEEESFEGNLEEESLLEDEDTVVYSPKDPVGVSPQNNPNTTSLGSNVIHTPSTTSWKADSEDRLHESLEENLLLKDEDMVEDSPKKFFVASGQDTTVSDVDEMEEHSNSSWTAGKEEKSLNGLECIHNPSTTSWKADSEDSFNESLEGSPLLKDEGMVLDSPKKLFVASDQDTTILDVDEMEEHSNSSWTAGKEEKSLNGSLERDSVFEDEDQVVYSPKSQFNVPEATISDVNDVQNHSNVSWTPDKDDESFNGSLKEESLLEDEDTVVYRPTVEESSPEVVEKVVDSHMKLNNAPDHDTANAAILIADDVEEQQTGMVKMEDEDTVEESTPEVVEKVVDSHMKLNNVPDYDTTNAAILIADDVEEQQTRRGKMEDEDTVEESTSEAVEKVVDSHTKLNNVPDREITNEAILIVDDVEEKQIRTVEIEDEDTVVDRPTVVESIPEVVEKVVDSHMELNNVPDHDTANTAILIVDDAEEQQTRRMKTEDEDTVVHRPTEESTPEEKVVDSHMELNNAPDHDTSNAVILTVDDVEEQKIRRVKMEDEDTVVHRPTVEESTPEVVEKVVESRNVPDHDTRNAAILVADDDVEEQQTRRDDREGESYDENLEKESVLKVEETVVDSTVKSIVVSDLLNTNTSNSDIAEELEKHPASEIDKEMEALDQRLEEKSTSEVEDTVVESSKQSLVVSDELNANAEILDAEDLDKHTKRKADEEKESINGNLQKESILESQDKVVDTSSDNVKKEAVCLSEENHGAMQSSNLDDEGFMEPHESEVEVDAVHFATDTVKNSLVVPGVVQTDTVAKDSDLDEFSRAPAVEESSISKMTNGTKLDAPVLHEIDAANLEECMQDTAPTTPDLEAPEPQSPTATLYPLSKPPFSGSQQDRLWEEQAEAYSGQGTPSRNEDHATQTTPCASPAPKEKPTSCDDQIQPASVGANSNGHAAVGAHSNGGGGENGSCSAQEQLQPKGNGKEKLHTPLRTLLLEDAHKNGFGGQATPNGVSSSPSFIRRLFRVMSTPSRTGDRDVSHTKLKKSSSMWVSCLGSPQVQQ